MAMLDYLKVLDVVACNGNNLDIGKDHFLNCLLVVCWTNMEHIRPSHDQRFM